MIALVFLFGLLLGSFYNVVSMRTLEGGNLSYPPSNCVSCKHRLGFLDLFPVLSFLFLRGKCRYCKEKISRIYPFTELLTAISYSLIVYKFGFTLDAAIQIILLTVLILATITDLKEMIVPDRFIIVGIISVVILRAIDGSILAYFVEALIVFVVLLLLAMLTGKMGGADVKLYALIGLSIGAVNSAESIFYASLVALVVYLFMSIVKKVKIDGKVEIPFVPFITIGVLGTYFINVFNF